MIKKKKKKKNLIFPQTVHKTKPNKTVLVL